MQAETAGSVARAAQGRKCLSRRPGNNGNWRNDSRWSQGKENKQTEDVKY